MFLVATTEVSFLVPPEFSAGCHSVTQTEISLSMYWNSRYRDIVLAISTVMFRIIFCRNRGNAWRDYWTRCSVGSAWIEAWIPPCFPADTLWPVWTALVVASVAHYAGPTSTIAGRYTSRLSWHTLTSTIPSYCRKQSSLYLASRWLNK